MENIEIALALIGAVCFGIVMGWITYGTLRRLERRALTDLTSIVGVLGGAAVTALFPIKSGGFGAYCIGLAIGFFSYLRTARQPGAPDWLGDGRPTTPARRGGGPLEDTVSH
jgi:NhaP-type Na+/H+ or K+/H+ antiporter